MTYAADAIEIPEKPWRGRFPLYVSLGDYKICEEGDFITFTTS